MVTAAAGIGLGLLVSSLAPTEVTAIAVIPLLLLPQLMLAGFLKLFKDMDILQQALTWFVPMRWSFEGLTWTELEAADYPSSIDTIFGFPMIDGLRDGHVLLDGAALAAFAVLFVCLTFVRLVTMRTSS